MSFVCIKHGESSVLCNGTRYDLPEEALNYKDSMFWVYLGVYIALVLFAGLMSGLTMGLLSLDILSLKVLQRGGKPLEKRHATKILPLVEKHHLLLVTLLLANAAAVESMPIFMDRISTPVIAICVSVTAVLFFGEVVPQALCTRYGLAIGATLAPFVKALMVLLFVVAWPISKLLDCLLGHEHSTFFRRAELKELVDLHKEDTDANEDPLSHDEVMIIQGALEMRNKTVEDKYTPLDNVYMLDINRQLDQDTMKEISRKGHSRVPVYSGERENIVGVLFVKSLVMLDPDDNTPIRDIYRVGSFLTSSTSEPLFELLDKFQTGKSHLCVVNKTQIDEGNHILTRVVGIITLEDVIELLIQEEIWDEADILRHRYDLKKQISFARAKIKRMKSVDPGDGGGRGPLSPVMHSEDPFKRRVFFTLQATISRYLPAILAVIKQAMVAANRVLIAILAMSLCRLGAIGPKPPSNTPRPRKFVKPQSAYVAMTSDRRYKRNIPTALQSAQSTPMRNANGINR